ncbi:hypothetical protein F0562_034839 [Nyssa sinensis]|uniref:Uncharacterized protein n=1 Tax=Nyssa sinensis TaxID=561372 RepID=A0A5J5ACF5_9ASTE|nr:hypothetical protein F0562_034839 [Nyssa sinensis]
MVKGEIDIGKGKWPVHLTLYFNDERRLTQAMGLSVEYFLMATQTDSAAERLDHKVLKILWSFILILLIGTSWGLAASSQTSIQDSDTPAHLNFFRSALQGRQRVLSCANDPTVCLDREKNPWGGSTCCFQKFCRDTMSDPNNCGACGQVCGYGFVCCDGKCVDIQNDPGHCGACFEECPGQERCSYAMCDYGG